MKLRYFSFCVLVILIAISGVFFNTNKASASCDPRSPQVSNPPHIQSITAPTGVYSDPQTIPVIINGDGSYLCEGNPSGGMGWDNVMTNVTYTVTDNSGNEIYTGNWSPTRCVVPICAERPININTIMPASTWPAGNYTLTALAVGPEGEDDPVTTPPYNTSTRSSTFSITRSSGNLSATNCAIAKDHSTCDTNISWNVTNPPAGSNTAVTTPTNITVGTGHTGSSTYPIAYGNSRYFFLYNNNAKLNEVNPTATCANNTIWNGTVCSTDPAPTGTISATDCSIKEDESTCSDTNVTWSTQNLVPTANTAVTHNNPNNTTVSTATSGNAVDSVVRYGVTTFYLYHNNLPLANARIEARCELGLSWTGSICTSRPITSEWRLGDYGECVGGQQTATWMCVPEGSTCNPPVHDPQFVTRSCATNAVCGTTHWGCVSGVADPRSEHSGISKWTWICNSRDGGSPSPMCTELKKKPIFIEN